MRHTLIAILTLLCLVAPLSAEEDNVIADAGAFKFTRADLERLLQYSPIAIQRQLKDNPQQQATAVKQIVENKIIADLAREKGFDKIPYVRDQINYMVNAFLASQYLIDVVNREIKISDDYLKMYYELHKKKYCEQVKVSHILIRVEPNANQEDRIEARKKAESMLNWLQKGEKFETLAEEYSQDPLSRKHEGDLGYIYRGFMPPEFDNSAFSMKPGQISEPIQTRFGYHIIRVEDFRVLDRPLEEVKADVNADLHEDLANQKLTEFVATVTRDVKYYWDKLITPPPLPEPTEPASQEQMTSTPSPSPAGSETPTQPPGK